MAKGEHRKAPVHLVARRLLALGSANKKALAKVDAEIRRVANQASKKAWVLANPEKQKDRVRRWREANIDKIRAYSRATSGAHKRRAKNDHLLRTYGLSYADKLSLIKKQRGLCPICHKGIKPGRNAHVDHCHNTGKVRGILCGKCNPALGGFCDDIRILQSAIAYLRKRGSVAK